MKDAELIQRIRDVWAMLGLAIQHVESGDRDGAKEVVAQAHHDCAQLVMFCDPDMCDLGADTIPNMAAALPAEAYESAHQVDAQAFPAAAPSLGAFELGSEACDCGEPNCIHQAFLSLRPH